MNKRADIAELNPSEPFIAYGRNTAFRFDTTKEALKHADGERVGVSRPHESAHLHVSGEATYTDDIPEVTGTLYAALGLSREPHARIKSMNLDAVRAQPGVVAVYTAKDIPGSNDVGPIVRGDDPILAEGLVQYHGQPVFAVIATSVEAARRAARLASKPEVIDYESLPALLTPEAAHAANAYVLPPMHMKRESSPGAVHKAIAKAPRKLKGTFDVGGQEQFYLEGQIAYARPTEDDGMLVQCSTQHPSEMQHVVAHALGLHAHHVRVECRRMGGGFGGKESQSALFACVAAIAAKKLGRAVKLRVDRDDDFLITGRRHCFHYEYEVGYDDEGRILGTEITMVSRAGFSADLSGPGDDPRDLPLRQRLLAARGGRARLFGQDQHAEQHRLPRLRRPAGRDRHRAHRRLDRARRRPRFARRAQAQLLREGRPEHALRPADRGQRDPRAGGRAGARERVPGAPRCHRRLQCAEPGAQEGPGAHAGEVRHLLQRAAPQPGRCAGARLQRRLDPGEPRRHRDGPGPEHQGGAGGGARAGRGLRERALHRDRHRQGRQHLGHGRLDRQRPQRQGGAGCSATDPRSAGGLRGAEVRLRRRGSALCQRHGPRRRHHAGLLRAGDVTPTSRACSSGATASTPRPRFTGTRSR